MSKIIVLEPDPDTFGMDVNELNQLGDLARTTGANLSTSNLKLKDDSI